MRIVIAGFGTVGQGFAEVLHLKSDLFDEPVKIVAAFDSKSYVTDSGGLDPVALVNRKKETGAVGPNRMGSGIDVLDSVDYDVLVEVSPTDIRTGGEGLRHVEHTLRKGKDVITVNKGPLALKFNKLNRLAKKKGSILRFEGSVGGAMPIINLCSENLRGEQVRSIRGIFNGTCNFILSRMDTGLPFEQALKEAQQLGYAETDPTYDIEGIDTACKVVILANSIFNRDVTFADVSITGITSVSSEAIALAADQGMVIRLIGEVSDTVLEVSPRLVPKGHPLSVSGTLNTARIQTDLAGTITISGKGAGRIETASAILSDLMAIMDSRR
ncbi:MAG: homoserine dehydrogenase [Methanomassiliicoccaceae archaeon]|jgi:homoserine dehydrogenase|nr:homoserine dehydrogenase [Methanomassiliicoccaceae archaeon]